MRTKEQVLFLIYVRLTLRFRIFMFLALLQMFSVTSGAYPIGLFLTVQSSLDIIDDIFSCYSFRPERTGYEMFNFIHAFIYAQLNN